MATGPGFPSPTGTYVPSFEASGRLAVGYSRNAKKFPINRWIKLTESPKNVGYYLKFSAQEAARVVSMNDYRWAWGATRPNHEDGLEQFNFQEFRCERFDYGFSLDDDTDEQADWPIGEQHSQIHAAKAMTARTIRALTVLTTASNWQTSADPDLSANHTATATAYVGDFLDRGTTSNPLIKQFLDKAVILINLDTLGVVEMDQLHVLMNPNTARQWAESAEIHDYIKGSPAAMDEVRTGSTPNAKYGPGLPSSIYGLPILVDNTVKVTSRKGSTLQKAFAFPDNTVAIVARVGELEGVYGMPDFSTMHVFWYKDEMTLERFAQPEHRRTKWHVTEATSEKLVSPLSGYLLTAATSPL